MGGLAAGAAVNLAAQAGDLLESWIKRGAGVKDSGTWFGPSGGVLDLVDSLLLAVPAALLVWPIALRS
jgi:phosphatidate cytidylyltransferase